MLLAIDIGNTSITFGLFKAKKLFRVFKVETFLSRKALRAEIRSRLKACGGTVDIAVVCSVVPTITAFIKKIVKEQSGCRVKIAGIDIKIPITNLYKNPDQVGSDRLVAAYACKQKHGYPALVIDFGTATTFDFIDRNGAYCGGMITPGVQISLDALHERTALLPKITMKTPKNFIGRNTEESIISGTAFGLSAMCDGLIAGFKNRYGKNLKVLATGGFSGFFGIRCKGIHIIEENLILYGIKMMAENESNVF